MSFLDDLTLMQCCIIFAFFVVSKFFDSLRVELSRNSATVSLWIFYTSVSQGSALDVSLLARASKKLSNQMTALANDIFDTFDYFWVCPYQKNVPSVRLRGGAAIIFLKSGRNPKQKKITINKPFVTPNFWCRNFSRMHHFWVWIFFVFKNYPIFGMKNIKCSKRSFTKKMIKNQT